MLLGTTETPYTGPPEQARTLPAERGYLLDTLGHYFPRLADVSQEQIKREFCGLRVLPRASGSPFSRSREVMIHAERGAVPRLVSVMGGKLTTYRLTAKKVLAKLAPSLPPSSARHDTAHLALSVD
jgi:glycerol-3-phosphate dehydrogenase